jgi:hypothetical protein
MFATSYLPSRDCSRTAVRPLRAVIFGLVVSLGVLLRGTSWAQPVGAEFQVNAYTTGNQSIPAVAADADGNFVVVWESIGQDGNFSGVFGQRYTSAGATAGAEFQANTYTTDFQGDPAVTVDADGDFVVVWGSYEDGLSYNGISGQRYTSAGVAAGAEFQVNTYTTSKQDYPAVAADADGDFVVVWQSRDQDGSYFGVFGQRFTSAGAAVGAEFQVNTFTTSYQYKPDVAADADGDFVVVWASRSQDGSGYGIFGQRYTSTGATAGTEFQVNTYTIDDQSYPAVAADADGDFVVVWHSDGQDGSLQGVFGQRYTSAGAAVGTEFQVNTFTAANQRFPDVAADADGNFVATWESTFFQDGNGAGVFGQRYTNAGTAVGAEFQVNTYTTSGQNLPAVAADADGDFVVAWRSTGQDGNLQGVFAQRFQPITATTTTSSTVTTSTTTTSTTTTTTTTSTTTTLPPSIPTLSGSAHLLLAALLAFAMFVLGLAWRLNSRAG